MGKPRRLSLDEDQKAARNVGSRATDPARALIGLPAFGSLLPCGIRPQRSSSSVRLPLSCVRGLRKELARRAL